jgi:hypothetical protein
MERSSKLTVGNIKLTKNNSYIIKVLGIKYKVFEKVLKTSVLPEIT